jgi:hypothetical protein
MEAKNAYKTSVRRPEGKIIYGRPGHRWMNSIKICHQEMGYLSVNGFIWLKVRPSSYERGNEPLRLAGACNTNVNNERCIQNCIWKNLHRR